MHHASPHKWHANSPAALPTMLLYLQRALCKVAADAHPSTMQWPHSTAAQRSGRGPVTMRLRSLQRRSLSLSKGLPHKVMAQHSGRGPIA